MTYFGYRSLLETLTINPKKKHFKKIVQHMLQFENKEVIDEDLIALLIRIGINQKWPVTLGRVVKQILTEDYKISMKSFQDFVLFLDKCKGYDEDAKRFVMLTSDTQNLDFTYDIVRPIFERSLKTKTGNDILKMFEQFRKNIKLNKAAKDLP